MTSAILLLVGLLVLLVLGALAYAAWFARQVGSDLPRVSVRIADQTEVGKTRVTLTLRATSRPFQFVRVMGDRADVEKAGVHAPIGFVPESEDRFGPETISWVPKGGALLLKPNEPVELTFSFDPSVKRTAPLRGWCEARLGIGGSIFPFTLIVGEQHPADIEIQNLRSEVYAKAGELGATPAELPEWQLLEKLESDRANA
jgi:hypothetical protein